MTPKLAEYWELYPQLFVTASHATQFNLEMPFGKGSSSPATTGSTCWTKSSSRNSPPSTGAIFNGRRTTSLLP
ncbi:MAG: hypothetical protein ACLT8E_10140 [Akkermansia sp.]